MRQFSCNFEMINKSGSTTLGVAQVVEHMEHLANPVNGALYSLLPPTVLAGYCILIPILFGFSIFFQQGLRKIHLKLSKVCVVQFFSSIAVLVV